MDGWNYCSTAVGGKLYEHTGAKAYAKHRPIMLKAL